MCSGREREERADKCAGEIMNMKMFCDPGAELFSPTLMPNATLVSSPGALRAPVSARLGLESNERHQRKRVFLQVGESQARSGVRMLRVAEEMLWKHHAESVASIRRLFCRS